MKKIIVRRAHVLAALRFNNLMAGRWFDSSFFSGNIDDKNPFTCPACLVGSALRRAVPKKTLFKKGLAWLDNVISCATLNGQITDINFADDYARENRYLNALSCKFEGMSNRGDKMGESYPLTKSQKKELHRWVKENIPVQFEVEVPWEYQ